MLLVPSGTSVKIGTIQRRLAWPLREGWHAQIEKCIPLCFLPSVTSKYLKSQCYYHEDHSSLYVATDLFIVRRRFALSCSSSDIKVEAEFMTICCLMRSALVLDLFLSSLSKLFFSILQRSSRFSQFWFSLAMQFLLCSLSLIRSFLLFLLRLASCLV